MIKSLVLVGLLLTPSLAFADTLAITHAEAWPMDGRGKVADATIVVRDGKMVSVTAQGAVPNGARVIDAGGRMVTPGLMNSATQLGLVETGQADETNDMSDSNATLGASFDVQYALNANSVLLPVVRADGVTRAVTYPGASGSAPFMGQGAVLRLVEANDVLDEAQSALYVQIGSGTLAASGGSRSGQWQLLRNALSDARDNVSAKVKSMTGNHRDLEAIGRVLDGTIPLVIVTERESDIRQAIALAGDYKIRVVIMGGDEAWRCASELAAAKIAVVLDPMDNLPISFDVVGARLDNAALLDKAGVTLGFYSSGNTIYLSYNAGEAMREAAGLAVANGLPYDKALLAMTVEPAKIFGISSHYGTLAAGMDADLVIWDGDPLEPGNYPYKVFVKGDEASLTTRQTLLRDRYAKPDALPPVYHK